MEPGIILGIILIIVGVVLIALGVSLIGVFGALREGVNEPED